MKALSIGKLGEKVGVNVETIRYYEKIGLLPEPGRTEAGYRQYGEDHLRRLHFIRRGRDLGFSIEAIRELLRLAVHPEHPCHNADRMAAEHFAEVERKIAELERLRSALSDMINCKAHTVAECRIIDALAS